MTIKGSSIQRKLIRVILLTSIAVLLLTCSAFFINEFITYRQASIRELSTLGQIVATNSSAALAFDDAGAAEEILSALKAESQIVAAAIYGKDDELFSRFPPDLATEALPVKPEQDGYRFEKSHLHGFQPIEQGEKRMGTLYLKSDMSAMYERFRLYGSITALVIVLALLLAYVLSKNLQQRISTPILALAETARAISDRQDYSVRAFKRDHDEIGLLTDAFNHMLTRIQDQTRALSESSARVHAVINSAMSAVIVMDSQGSITDWNVRAENLFGWTRSEAIGRELASTIIPENFRQQHRKGLHHFIQTGEGPVIDKLLEMTALRRDGSEFPIELSISALKDDQSISFCGFITDITDRKRAESEIKLFNQRLSQMVAERTIELEVANQELESFSYSISHDLRAPLRSIHGYMNILAEEYESTFDDEAKRLIHIILKNGQRMGQLIDDLLAFSRLGRREIVKSEISMVDMVGNIIEDYHKADATDNATITLLTLPPAHGDHSAIRQVWVNLISNAVKYSKHKEKIIIEIGAQEAGDGNVIYYVKDNGVGFDMKYYDKLFGVFQRLHSEREFEGTGVGLAIVQRIVAKHGGKIWAEAKVNEGATFFFSLENRFPSAQLNIAPS
jgi:PAS domain S-box-containing protein